MEDPRLHIGGDAIRAEVEGVSGGQVGIGKSINQASRDLYSAQAITVIYQSAGVDLTTTREELSSEVCAKLLEEFISQSNKKDLPLETMVSVLDESLQILYDQGEKLNSAEIRPSRIKRLKDQIQNDLQAYRQSKQDLDLAPKDELAQTDTQNRLNILEQDIKRAGPLLQTALALFHQQVGASRSVILTEEPIPSEKQLPERPYKFLDSFEEKDAAIFFGRKSETKNLVSQILAHRLTVFFAKSGCGKTSLLKAGVSPKLHEEGYLTVHSRLIKDPSAEIKQAINSRLSQWMEVSQETTLAEFLDKVTKREKKPLVLILDQFEEFFTRLSPSIRESFIEQLAKIYYTSSLPVRLVISLQEDFLPELGEVEAYILSVFNNKYRLQPLTDKQAKEAIEEPAKLYGVSYERGLRDQILSDLSQQGVKPVEPPQLQIVCDKLWRLRNGQAVVTREMYEQAGGTRQILAGYVEEVLVEFGKESREVARAILKETVTSQKMKTLLDLLMLQERLATKFSSKVIEQALERLERRRLIRKLEKNDTFYYELAHQYLVEKIQDWFDDVEMKQKKAHEMLERALAEYDYSGSLLSRNQIKIVEQYQDRLALSHKAQDLLHRSKKQKKRVLLNLAMPTIILLFLTLFAIYQGYQDHLRKKDNMGKFPKVSNLDHAELRLYHIREDDQAEEIEYKGGNVYLKKGDYYLQAKKGEWTLKYPVYIKGYNTIARPVEIKISEGSPPKDSDEMVYIPASWFQMGDKEGKGYPDEKPAHDVYVDAFFIDKREVTNKEYKKFIEAKGYNKELDASDEPVTRVSWLDAYAYCEWASKELPTEAEWEKAARGPEGYLYAYGNIYDDSKTKDPKDPNGYGLYSMTGSVWEWVFDWYDKDYYQSSPDTNPKGPEEGIHRILRGGSSAAGSDYTRASHRRWHFPPGYTSSTAGFRCIRRIDDTNPF
jgi:ABC-type Fe3+/spermidine/putrescine transport system ATPase subunit